ncbi:hypothetical protein [uncultured Psychroserpens sp.]|uniref:hypothetical protein n=1 Tax=uncultured Psychroserpens sp. TaxID=255436 RepID=UPI00261C0E2D|nr:hypothetical protein [uncultured Psychroserpens sp.]
MGGSKNIELNNKIKSFLTKVTVDNYYTLYDEFKILLEKYKSNFTKPEILELLFDYVQNNNLEEYQEEVIIEIENRIFGYCSPDDNIIWEEE